MTIHVYRCVRLIDIMSFTISDAAVEKYQDFSDSDLRLAMRRYFKNVANKQYQRLKVEKKILGIEEDEDEDL